MITDPCISFSTEGIKFNPCDFFIDPRKPVKNAVITHAHADHVTKGSRKIFCTPATAGLIMHRYKKSINADFVLHDYNEPFEFNNAIITFLGSGHMLGSAQVLVEYNSKKYLFTGDFKLQHDETCIPYEYVKCDVLIIESTFANPEIIHPDPVQEILKLNDITQQRIVLGSYVLGKAQRITQLLAKNCPGKIILTHHEITGFHKVYQQYKVELNNWIPYSRSTFKHTVNSVYLVPPVTYKYYYRQPGIIKAFASGWKNLQHGADVVLLISDHADWHDLLKVINYSQPELIITLHGDGTHLQNHFSNSNIKFNVLNDY